MNDLNQKINELIENSFFLLFLDEEINSIFPKYVIVRRSNGRLTEGVLTELFTNTLLEEEYGVVDVGKGRGCKIVTIKSKNEKFYEVLSEGDFEKLKIYVNDINGTSRSTN